MRKYVLKSIGSVFVSVASSRVLIEEFLQLRILNIFKSIATLLRASCIGYSFSVNNSSVIGTAIFEGVSYQIRDSLHCIYWAFQYIGEVLDGAIQLFAQFLILGNIISEAS